jgi:hypothetical protein
MVTPFNELRERLLRAGIAPRHVRRYLKELADHLADLAAEEKSRGLNREEAESAALARLGSMDDLARAMIEQRQLQSWSFRAPWAAFGLAPLLGLAAAWFAALFILWSGWNIFLPGTVTPFGAGPLHGFANAYFQFGRMIYFFAPVFIGWGVALVAARQRLSVGWPALGLALLAWAGTAARVHAGHSALSGVANVGMSFSLGNSAGEIVHGLLRASVLLSLMVLPYLIWRLQRSFLRSTR